MAENGIALIHEGVSYEDCTVYLSGNAYYDCRFVRCTLVIRECGVPALVGCYFECCNWHIDMLVSDHTMWESFTKLMVGMVQQSLPRAFAREGEGSVQQEKPPQ